jgi:transposase
MRTHGSALELEARRRIAGRLLLEGRTVTEVARLVGASWSAVKRWKVAAEKSGLEGLSAKPHPGKPPRLSTKQRAKLVAVLKRGPLAAGYETNLWTCPRVAEVIHRHFGVSYHAAHVWKILRGLGWSPQKPQRRARERDEQAIERWRKQQWPRLKKVPRRRPSTRDPR